MSHLQMMDSWTEMPEVGTNNIISKAEHNKAQCKMHNLIFSISEVHRNFRNELFDSVQVQRNSTIVEPHFYTKLKCNL